MKAPKGYNFFRVPHALYDSELSHAERDFFSVLCHLSNRYADRSGWFWHPDESFTTEGGKLRGLTSYGFSRRTCCRARSKLCSLGLIETKKQRSKGGHVSGTLYRIKQ